MIVQLSSLSSTLCAPFHTELTLELQSWIRKGPSDGVQRKREGRKPVCTECPLQPERLTQFSSLLPKTVQTDRARVPCEHLLPCAYGWSPSQCPEGSRKSQHAEGTRRSNTTVDRHPHKIQAQVSPPFPKCTYPACTRTIHSFIHSPNESSEHLLRNVGYNSEGTE